MAHELGHSFGFDHIKTGMMFCVVSHSLLHAKRFCCIKPVFLLTGCSCRDSEHKCLMNSYLRYVRSYVKISRCSLPLSYSCYCS